MDTAKVLDIFEKLLVSLVDEMPADPLRHMGHILTTLQRREDADLNKFSSGLEEPTQVGDISPYHENRRRIESAVWLAELVNKGHLPAECVAKIQTECRKIWKSDDLLVRLCKSSAEELSDLRELVIPRQPAESIAQIYESCTGKKVDNIRESWSELLCYCKNVPKTLRTTTLPELVEVESAITSCLVDCEASGESESKLKELLRLCHFGIDYQSICDQVERTEAGGHPFEVVRKEIISSLCEKTTARSQRKVTQLLDLFSFSLRGDHIGKFKRSNREFSEDDFIAVYVYTTEISELAKDKQLWYVMNRAMRNGDEHIIADFKSLIVSINYGLHCLSPLRSTVYRGINVRCDKQKTYKTRGKIVWPSFSSTSASASVARKFAINEDGNVGTVFIIQSDTSKPIAIFSQFPEEEEQLYPSHSEFEVIQVLPESHLQLLGVNSDVITMREVVRGAQDNDSLHQKLQGCDTTVIYEEFLKSFTPPRARTHPDAKESFPLIPVLQSTIKSSEDFSLTVIGSRPGGGKTTLGLWMVADVMSHPENWRRSETSKVVTFFISLPILRSSVFTPNCIHTYLRYTYSLTEKELETLRREYEVIFILDSLDEVQSPLFESSDSLNLVELNGLQSWKKASAVITCRDNVFIQYPPGKIFAMKREWKLLYIGGFQQDDIEYFLHKTLMDAAPAIEVLKSSSNISSLLSSPFVLWFVSPYIVELNESSKGKVISIANCYEFVLGRRMMKSARRLHKMCEELSGASVDMQQMLHDSFMFGQACAIQLMSGPEVTSSVGELWRRVSSQSWEKWASEVLQACYKVDPKAVMQEATRAQVSRSDSVYEEGTFSFRHLTILEYLVARELWEHTAEGMVIAGKLIVGGPATGLNVISMFRSIYEAKARNPGFGLREWESVESELTSFLRYREAGETPESESESAIASSAAFTLLCAGRRCFEKCDWRGLIAPKCRAVMCSFSRCSFAGACLRGADVKNSMFSHCDLRGADLRDVEVDNFAPVEFKGSIAGFVRHYSVYSSPIAASRLGTYFAVTSGDELFFFSSKSVLLASVRIHFAESLQVEFSTPENEVFLLTTGNVQKYSFDGKQLNLLWEYTSKASVLGKVALSDGGLALSLLRDSLWNKSVCIVFLSAEGAVHQGLDTAETSSIAGDTPIRMPQAEDNSTKPRHATLFGESGSETFVSVTFGRWHLWKGRCIITELVLEGERKPGARDLEARISASGVLIVTGSECLRVFGPEGALIRVIKCRESEAIDISPCGSFAVSSEKGSGAIDIWNIKTGELLRKIQSLFHSGGLHDPVVKYSTDGQVIFIASKWEGRLISPSGEVVRITNLDPSSEGILKVVFLGSASLVVCTSRQTQLFTVANEGVESLEHMLYTGLTIGNDGKHIAAWQGQGAHGVQKPFHVWSTDGTLIRSIPGFRPRDVHISDSGNVAVLEADRVVLLQEQTGAIISHPLSAARFKWSSNDAAIAENMSKEGFVVMKFGEEIQSFETAMLHHPNVSAYYDGKQSTLQIRREGRPDIKLTIEKANLRISAFSDDGDLLFVVAGEVIAIDCTTGAIQWRKKFGIVSSLLAVPSTSRHTASRGGALLGVNPKVVLINRDGDVLLEIKRDAEKFSINREGFVAFMENPLGDQVQFTPCIFDPGLKFKRRLGPQPVFLLSPAGKYCACCEFNGHIRLIDVDSMASLCTLPFPPMMNFIECESGGMQAGQELRNLMTLKDPLYTIPSWLRMYLQN